MDELEFVIKQIKFHSKQYSLLLLRYHELVTQNNIKKIKRKNKQTKQIDQDEQDKQDKQDEQNKKNKKNKKDKKSELLSVIDEIMKSDSDSESSPAPAPATATIKQSQSEIDIQVAEAKTKAKERYDQLIQIGMTHVEACAHIMIEFDPMVGQGEAIKELAVAKYNMYLQKSSDQEARRRIREDGYIGPVIHTQFVTDDWDDNAIMMHFREKKRIMCNEIELAKKQANEEITRLRGEGMEDNDIYKLILTRFNPLEGKQGIETREAAEKQFLNLIHNMTIEEAKAKIMERYYVGSIIPTKREQMLVLQEDINDMEDDQLVELILSKGG